MNAADQALAMLRFNWVHYNNPWCPPWACSDTLLQLKADSVLESEGMAALQKELTEIQDKISKTRNPRQEGHLTVKRGPSCSIEVPRCSSASSDESCAVTTLICSCDARSQLYPAWTLTLRHRL